MPDPISNSNPIRLSLEQMLKYIKGNLLGNKKQEIEDKIQASPLLADAIDGLKEFENTDKIERTIDELNRQIQLKSGASKIEHTNDPFEQEVKGSSTSSPAPFFSIAASLGALIIVSGVFYWIYTNRSNAQLAKPLANVEETTIKSANSASEPDLKINIDSNEIISDSAKIPDNDLIAMNESDEFSTHYRADNNTEFKKEELSDRYKDIDFRSEPSAAKNKATMAETKTSANKERTAAESSKNENLKNAVIEKESEELNYGEGITDSIDNRKYNKSYSSFDDITSKSQVSNYSVAVELMEANKLDEALNKFNQIAEEKNNPNKDDAYWNMAQIYMKKGDAKSAKKVLKKVKNSAKYGTKAQLLLEQL